MKKILVLILLIFAMAILFTGCNRSIIDTTYKFDQGIVHLADGTVVKGKVQSWKDFADGDQIQIKIDGKTYLVHSVNASLISN